MDVNIFTCVTCSWWRSVFKTKSIECEIMNLANCAMRGAYILMFSYCCYTSIHFDICCYIVYRFPISSYFFSNLWVGFCQGKDGVTARRRKKFAQQMLTLTRLTNDMKLRILMYYYCTRYYFADQQNISLSVDGSRIGCVSRLLGLIARPDGFGAWLAPQAPAANPKDHYPHIEQISIVHWSFCKFGHVRYFVNVDM